MTASGSGFAQAGRLEQDLALGGEFGVVDVDLQQEAVELGFGQGIGAFLLERVLGGEHMEGRRQVITLAGDRDVIFLHRLQKGRLGTRRSAVDLVGHQELGEDRALDETEGAASTVVLVHHLGAENIRGHQIRRELDAVGGKAEHLAERRHQSGLGKTGNADEQSMTA